LSKYSNSRKNFQGERERKNMSTSGVPTKTGQIKERGTQKMARGVWVKREEGETMREIQSHAGRKDGTRMGNLTHIQEGKGGAVQKGRRYQHRRG